MIARGIACRRFDDTGNTGLAQALIAGERLGALVVQHAVGQHPCIFKRHIGALR